MLQLDFFLRTFLQVKKEPSRVPVSHKEFVHSINNQLTLLVARAEMLSMNADPQAAENCRLIKAAALTIGKLVNEFARHRA
jgi:hypothetical protein